MHQFRHLTERSTNDASGFPLSLAMIQEGGYCYQFDYMGLVRRVGEDALWPTILATVHQAMEAWAQDDGEAAYGRAYSVWLGVIEGVMAVATTGLLAFVSVVEHRPPDFDQDDATDELSPFDHLLPQMPEFVRTEAAVPVWDGAAPYYLVQGRTVLPLDRDSDMYLAQRDAALADFWQGQLMLDETGGANVHVQTDTPQMQRGADAYLRNFLRERRTHYLLVMPLGQSGEAAPSWLQEYFASGGQMFHTADSATGGDTVLFILTSAPELVLNAPVVFGLEPHVDDRALSHFLIFQDPADGDLAAEFIYSLALVDDLEQLASLGLQERVRLYVYATGDKGDPVLQGVRELALDQAHAEGLGERVARIVRAFADPASLLPSEKQDASPTLTSSDVAILLSALQDRDARAQAVTLLCSTRSPEFIGPVITAAKRMTWEEVDAIYPSLHLLGEDTIEPLVEMATAAKKSTAACGMRALAYFPCDRTLGVLVDLAEQRESKGEPFEALVQLGDYALPALDGLAQHRHAGVREMAAYALGKIADPGAIARLLDMARSDRTGKVRNMAARALKWIAGEEECEIDFRDFSGNIARVEPLITDDAARPPGGD